jgi:hypothetical protein
MTKRKLSGSAFDNFRKNVYPFVLKHAGDDFMDYHICLICHPSGELKVDEGKPLPSCLYKCVASKKNNGEISFKMDTEIFLHILMDSILAGEIK